MNVQEIIRRSEESGYLISMIPMERLVEMGREAGMGPQSTVLDLCCGYGEMLKLWHEAFGIRGLGVDQCEEFLQTGQRRLREAGISDISLRRGDVLKFKSQESYDFVSCTEIFGSYGETVDLRARHLRPGGKLLMGSRYAKTDPVPPELTEFEGETLPLARINAVVRARGWYMTGMASCTDAAWERYVMWSARRHLAALRAHPDDTKARAWCDQWYEAYFGFRRACEGFAMFILEQE
ncbi:MAG: class I SAM-dependent methyltransferase [Oscillospiraceae bacterium]|jgi:cyclopropane fatty-acyl-phospholipid synthase-like methyltransferase|nr:class I SAM-dependent methyltransferase [Oscillospiraceae bacterium]